jgi:phasin
LVNGLCRRIRTERHIALQQNCCIAQKFALYERHSFNERLGNPGRKKGTEMAKTSEKTTTDFIENVEFPSFDASKATDQIRAFAEKGVEQSKEAYAKLKTGAEETQKALEASFETARSVSSDLSLKTISALRANAEADFSYLEALVGAKSVSEFVELQAGFLRKRVEMGVEQVKDFQATATKAAEELAKPIKTAFEKTVKELKVA